MKSRINPNPQNGGNEEQLMQNQAQTNGQAYLAQPYGNVPTPQNYNVPTGQQPFDINCHDEQNGNDYQQYNNWQYQWYDNSNCQYDYPANNNFSNNSDFQTSNININFENVAADAFDSPSIQQNYYECYDPPRQKSGRLFNPLRAMQPIDYSDMDCDGCTPTNVDGGLDVKQQGFVLIEMKCLPKREKWLVQTGRLYPPNRIPQPQKIYLECDIDAKQRGGSPSALFLADHDVFDPRQTVNAAYTIVLAVYYHGRWYIAKNRRILKDCVRFFWDAVLSGNGDNLDYYYANEF